MPAERAGGAQARALNDLIDEAATLAGQRSRTAAHTTEAFVREYYRFVAPEDLLSREPLDLAGAALSHLELAHRRTQGTALVRVLSPTVEVDGWHSPHTVVEVVTDDMPFLVDTATAELTRHDLAIHLVVHPVVHVRRDAVGQLLDVLDGPVDDDPHVLRESFIHVEITRVPDDALTGQLRNDLRRVLEDVRAAVEDWHKMTARLEEAVAEAKDNPRVPAEEASEVAALAAWMLDDGFTFLGYREYRLTGTEDDRALSTVPATGLGILRDAGLQPTSHSFAKLPAEVRRRASDPSLLTVTKANSRATVHRPAYLDYVSIKRLDARGRPVGERRFLGLFAHSAYVTRVSEIPVVRRKVKAVLDRSGFTFGSHDYKTLEALLDDYPRDELFQISVADLLAITTGILNLQERRQVRLFTRYDDYDRFVSCLVFLPRERYNTANRLRVQQLLLEAYDGRSLDHTVHLSESILARLHVVVRTSAPDIREVDTAALEQRLETATRSWEDALAEALVEALGEADAGPLRQRYAGALPEAYKEDVAAAAAVPDLLRLERLGTEEGLDLCLYRPLGAEPGEQRLKVFRVGGPLSLSQVMPVLQDMGVEVTDERPYEVRRPGLPEAWIYDFGLRSRTERAVDDTARNRFQDAFAAIWRGDAESDSLNALVLSAALTWREVVVLRAYGKYLRQTGWTFSEAYVAQTLVRNPHLARQLVALFEARLDPARPEPRDEASLVQAVRQALDEVASLDEDRILRAFLGLVTATLRTNAFQDGGTKQHLSLKLDPTAVRELPAPRPMFEIFVYSPRVEGVHLRFGAVARGGLRWSDRREDFRTEVLGLVKAQMVKNAVIVPVGAKGGFVVKTRVDPADREAWLAEGVACYRTFVQGLLDVSDNIVAGQVVPPRDLVRHDGDDPYLVVAADKGTATFSDIANDIALENGFWLGDAFASGGSAGYDHKAMGITARGAWESVKRHFLELDTDVQTQPFTVVGIGDMSGDVFGNGMLLSEQIRLVAAFDHRHVFLDPDPDPTASFRERERLFHLPRSSWDDYDKALISKGGGVFPRTAKAIPLSPQVRARLGVEAGSLTPAELIRAILLAPVDLLWNGGIGTYVKARAESHTEVGDKANDAVRVDGADLRCRVVGEGGNLGLTQRGRVEFALAGGHVNTDAIDNSAGVDTSDHEVNIKILLDQAVTSGDLTQKQRNELLEQMTDEVARLVLRDNYEQNVALANARAQSLSMLPVHRRYLDVLERTGHVDRALEFLPDDPELDERAAAGIGLTGPEFAVLMAWTKIWLTQDILASDVPEDPYLSHELEHYFPAPLRVRFREQMGSHRLRREIIATALVNRMVNHAGTTFAYRMGEELAAAASDVVRAHTVASEVFAVPQLWREVEALDTRVPTATQTTLLLEGRRLVERASRWLLTTPRQPLDIAATIRTYQSGAVEVTQRLPEWLTPEAAEAVTATAERWASQGVPHDLAVRVAGFPLAYNALDVVEVAAGSGRPVEEVAPLYFALDGMLEIGRLRRRVVALPRADRWQSLARTALRDDLDAAQAALAAEILTTTEPGPPDKRIATWSERNAAAVARAGQVLNDIVSDETYDVTTLSVALRQIRGLAQSSTVGGS